MLRLETDADACRLAEHEDVFETTTKAKSGDTRFALRFQESEAMKSVAKTHHLPDQSDKGRLKLTGVNPTIGLHGVATFLLERQWSEIETLYISDGSASFFPSGAGDATPAFYLFWTESSASWFWRHSTHELEKWWSLSDCFVSVAQSEHIGHLQCGSNVVVIVHCDHHGIVTWRIHQFSSSCNPPSVLRGCGRCLGLTQESQRTIHGPLKPKPWHALSTWVVGDRPVAVALGERFTPADVIGIYRQGVAWATTWFASDKTSVDYCFTYVHPGHRAQIKAR